MRIPLSKAAAMSHLLMLVSTGYKYWTKGEVKIDKAILFAKKMEQLYPISATSDQRSWAKKTGKYSAILIMYEHDKDPQKILFWLVATEGKAPKGYMNIHEREKLFNAETSPMGWRDQYELLRAEKKGKKPTWTWVMRRDYFAMQLAATKEAADAGSDALKTYFQRIAKMPMFGGIRSQIVDLDEHARITWKKSRKSAYVSPLKPDGALNESAAIYLPRMPKITVWGDFTLAILVDKMNEKCLQAFINGCEQADAALSEVEF